MARAARAGRNTQNADLRAGLRLGAAQAEPAPKPPKRKAPKETDDERAEKAERIAQAQHQTSLLSGKPSKGGRRYGEYKEKKKSGGLLLQLVLVIAVAAGIAMAIDPSMVPIDWHQVREFVGHYVKL